MFKNRRERFEEAINMSGFGEDFRGGGPFRARRGMIEPAILEALLTHPMHGYEIMDKIEEDSRGMWRPSAGSIYPTLQMLEEKDLVTSTYENGKKVYELTAAGREEADKAKEQHEHLRDFWTNRKEESTKMHEVGKEIRDIMHIVKRNKFDKSPEKTEKLLLMLRTFKQNLVEMSEE